MAVNVHCFLCVDVILVSGNMEGKGATTDKEGHYYNKPGGLFTGNKDL